MEYIRYQSKYLNNPRRSDLEIIRICKGIYQELGDNLKLLDIGCSQGNLLHEIKEYFPKWNLLGGDLSPVEIEECSRQSRLKGIDFKVMDIFDLPFNVFDVIVVNAVFFALNNHESQMALKSISNSLRNSGTVIIFDMLSASPQNLQIIEENLSEASLKQININIRNIKFFESLANNEGLKLEKVTPFYIDIDLPYNEKSIVSHTKNFGNLRHSFRGSIFQPWHHIILRKN